ncbi:MAG: YbaY family lipoprotein [Chloroflexota bacterium]
MKTTKMRVILLAGLALLMVVMAACSPAVPEIADQTAMESAPAGNTVTGTVTKLDRSALSPNAIVEVQLRETSIADAPATILATQTIPANGQELPLPFELSYDPAQIVSSGLYSIFATITVDGQLQYISQSANPVITNGAPTAGVEVLVSPVASESFSGMLTGTVSYLDRSALEPNAVIEVDLVDVSSGVPGVIATTQTNADGRQPPIPFEMAFDPALIDPAGTYLANGRILVDDQVRYASQAGVLVLTNGAPVSDIEIIVTPVQGGTPDGSGTIRGTITTPRPPAVLEAGSVLQVELREPMLADAPATAINEIPVGGMGFPITFDLDYNPSEIAADRAYVVAARILSEGRLVYTTLAPVPVLTAGAPGSDITVPVGVVPDPMGGALRFLATSSTPMTWPAGSNAYLNVEIREPMLADAPATAFTYIPLAGLSFPVGFQIGYDSAAIDPNKAYILDARVIDNNELTFSAAEGVPVLTQGALVNDVEIPMVAEGAGSAGSGDGLLSGVISTDQPSVLDAGSVWYVDLREAGTTGDPMVTVSSILGGTQFPIPFEVPYNPATIDPSKVYVVGARILLGDQVLYASAVGEPVLTLGAPQTGVVVNIPPQ